MADSRKAQLIYLLYGDDTFTRDEQVRALRRRASTEALGDYNVTELAGEISLSELRAAADALPFLSDRRLVIVHGLVGRLTGTGSRRRGRSRAKKSDVPVEVSPFDQFMAYLGGVAESTALVLVEDSIDLAPLEAAIAKGRAHVRRYDRPRPAELPQWIQRRARHHGAEIEAAAARALAQLGADNLRLIDNELAKLAAFAGDRTIGRDDVELLTSSPEVSVFALTDAVGDGNHARALEHLHTVLRRGERPEAILPQIIAVFRRLAQARDLIDGGVRGAALQSRLGVHPFVAEKTERQARRYSFEQIEMALGRLLATDRAIKTGESDPELAVELLLTELPRASAA